jgi:hypothetical protein
LYPNLIFYNGWLVKVPTMANFESVFRQRYQINQKKINYSQVNNRDQLTHEILASLEHQLSRVKSSTAL